MIAYVHGKELKSILSLTLGEAFALTREGRIVAKESLIDEQVQQPSWLFSSLLDASNMSKPWD